VPRTDNIKARWQWGSVQVGRGSELVSPDNPNVVVQSRADYATAYLLGLHPLASLDVKREQCIRTDRDRLGTKSGRHHRG